MTMVRTLSRLLRKTIVVVQLNYIRLIWKAVLRRATNYKYQQLPIPIGVKPGLQSDLPEGGIGHLCEILWEKDRLIKL